MVEMVEEIALSTNKIHEEDSLVVLNDCTKGTMINHFRREYFPQPFISEKVSETEIDKPIGASTNEIYQK